MVRRVQGAQQLRSAHRSSSIASTHPRPSTQEPSIEYLVFAGDTFIGWAELDWAVPPALPPSHEARPGRLPTIRFWNGPFRPADAYAAIADACRFELGARVEAMAAFHARQQALALTLRTADGSVVPTHFVMIQDATELVVAVHPPDADHPAVRQVIAMPAELDVSGQVIPVRPA